MTHPQPKPFRITLPKRYCANAACKREISVTSKYATCSFRCKLAVDRAMAEVERAGSEVQDQPF